MLRVVSSGKRKNPLTHSAREARKRGLVFGGWVSAQLRRAEGEHTRKKASGAGRKGKEKPP